MASSAHCAYCFETLSASFNKRQPLNLAATEHLWAAHEASISRQGSAANVMINLATTSSRSPAITRLLSPSTASSSSVPSASSSTPSLNTNVSSATSISSKSDEKSSTLLASLKQNSSLQYDEYPLFVTWDIRSRSGHKNLRGCIGTFEAQELEDGLRSYALTSAFDDTRFNPISQQELPLLECSVTLLTDFEPVADPMDWQIGTHGLRISFSSNGRRLGATYLPDVAREQGWTKDETIISLMRKAGWGGHKTEWKKVPDLQVTRYQGKKCSLEYNEWRAWRDWVKKADQEEETNS